MTTSKPVIGLVGGIGSGKSMVARYMAEAGGLWIDADALARQALQRDDVRRQLRDWWGDAVMDDSGAVDRQRLASLVFDHPEQRRKLEELIHPIVAAERERMIARATDDPAIRFIVLDVPLLLEVGLAERCDRIVFVRADRAVRLERLSRDRGWDEAELQRREKNQMPLDMKLKHAHNMVDNHGSATECRAQVLDLLDAILINNQSLDGC